MTSLRERRGRYFAFLCANIPDGISQKESLERVDAIRKRVEEDVGPDTIIAEEMKRVALRNIEIWYAEHRESCQVYNNKELVKASGVPVLLAEQLDYLLTLLGFMRGPRWDKNARKMRTGWWRPY